MAVSGVPIPRDEIIEAIKAQRGNIRQIAAALGCSESAVYARSYKDKEIADLINHERTEFRKSLVHLAENQLEKKIIEGDSTCTIFALKTQGRDAGYSQQELETLRQAIHLINRGGSMDKPKDKEEN